MDPMGFVGFFPSYFCGGTHSRRLAALVARSGKPLRPSLWSQTRRSTDARIELVFLLFLDSLIYTVRLRIYNLVVPYYNWGYWDVLLVLRINGWTFTPSLVAFWFRAMGPGYFRVRKSKLVKSDSIWPVKHLVTSFTEWLSVVTQNHGIRKERYCWWKKSQTTTRDGAKAL